MLFIRTLFVGLIALLAFGCSGNSDVAGSYATEVSQSSGKEVIVGDLELRPDGQYQAKIGELSMSGKWSAGGGRVFLQGGDDVSRFLPSQYRVDGDRLIAQFEGVDAKHWRFVKKRSQAVANRLQ
jgi:hypothetical protein